MPDRLTEILILLLRPIEKWHEHRVKRAYAKGRFRIPEDNRAGAVTTRRTK